MALIDSGKEWVDLTTVTTDVTTHSTTFENEDAWTTQNVSEITITNYFFRRLAIQTGLDCREATIERFI